MQVLDLLDKEKIWYKHAGKDVLVHCLNPEHPDSNPSMRIDKITGKFNCFSCGFGGNLYTHFNESFDILGVKVLQLKNKISEILRNEILLPLGREPFKRKHRNISGETYKHFDAFTHDDFDGRIVFPIYDITGRLVGLVGRYAFSDANPKYLMDPPGVQLPLYPAHPDTYKDSVILVEGIFDFLNLWDKGVTNVICGFGKSMGEAKKKIKRELNLQKFIPLKIQGIKKIFILYDAGATFSAKELANLLSDLFLVEVIEYPTFDDDKDPGNMTTQEVQELKEFIYESDSL